MKSYNNGIKNNAGPSFGMTPRNIKRANKLENLLKNSKGGFEINAGDIRYFVETAINSAKLIIKKMVSTKVCNGVVLSKIGVNGTRQLELRYANGTDEVKAKTLTDTSSGTRISMSHSGPTSSYERAEENKRTEKAVYFDNQLQSITYAGCYEYTEHANELIGSAFSDAYGIIEENKIKPVIEWSHTNDFKIIPCARKLSETYNLPDGDILCKNFALGGEVSSEELRTAGNIIIRKDKNGNRDIRFNNKIGFKIDPSNKSTISY